MGAFSIFGHFIDELKRFVIDRKVMCNYFELLVLALK